MSDLPFKMPASKSDPKTSSGSDGEVAQPLVNPNPPRRLPCPANLDPSVNEKNGTQHGHSPLIPWGTDEESKAAKPFKIKGQ